MFVLLPSKHPILEPDCSYKRLFSVSLCLCVMLLAFDLQTVAHSKFAFRLTRVGNGTMAHKNILWVILTISKRLTISDTAIRVPAISSCICLTLFTFLFTYACCLFTSFHWLLGTVFTGYYVTSPHPPATPAP